MLGFLAENQFQVERSAVRNLILRLNQGSGEKILVSDLAVLFRDSDILFK